MSSVRTIVNDALRLINSIQVGENATAAEMETSLAFLNSMIDSWSNDELNRFLLKPYYFNTVPNQKEYTLGPEFTVDGEVTGADWVIKRPMRLEKANVYFNAVMQPFPPPAPPPPPPPPACNLVSSTIDENTIDLWHFDEGVGATNTTATVWAGEELADTFPLDPGFSLQLGCCDTGLLLGDGIANNQLAEPANFFNSISLPDGFTYEFSLNNTGVTEPDSSDYAEVFRADLFTYSLGEGLSIVTAFKVGNSLVVTVSGTTLCTIPLPVGDCIAICLQAAWDGTVDIYANGTRVFTDNSADIWSFSGSVSNTGGFVIFTQDGSSNPDTVTHIIIDEFRRSNIVRYSGETYQYTVEV